MIAASNASVDDAKCQTGTENKQGQVLKLTSNSNNCASIDPKQFQRYLFGVNSLNSNVGNSLCIGNCILAIVFGKQQFLIPEVACANTMGCMS